MIRLGGIGPRAITQEGIAMIHHVATQFAQMGMHMNSGHGEGADQAWAAPFPDNQKSIYVPWWGFNGALPETDDSPFKLSPLREDYIEFAKFCHPAWQYLTQGQRSLMVRNVSILLSGKEERQVDALVYWQVPNVKLNDKGGTQHCLRVANRLGIPAFNINTEEGQQALDAWVSNL